MGKNLRNFKKTNTPHLIWYVFPRIVRIVHTLRGDKHEGVNGVHFLSKKIHLGISYCYYSFMRTILSVLISGVFLLTACSSSSASAERCDQAMDELGYLSQTGQNNDEYFELSEFVRNNCLGVKL